MDARLLRLDDVPPGYLAVSSALGRSEPAHLLIVPLLADGTVIGVLELGLLHRPTTREETFLTQAAGTIGMALKAAQYRHRLRETLEETQQLNEELQTQQEELKTANEELEEQSQAMREVQLRLENQQFELEQNNARLDEQAQRLLQQRDHLDARNQALDATRSELERKTRELQRLSEYKSEFLANMSHELRTPLNSALIFARLLADNPNGNLDAEQVRYASLIAAAGSDLLNLINDILDLSKVEAGMLEVHPEPTLIREVVDHTAAPFRSLAEQKRLHFETKIDAEVPRLIETDGLRLRQILKNLLSNAIKFTERGFIRLQVWKVESGVAFEVLDSGIGIPTDQQETIFEAFRQADGATNRQYGGTGLGLSISRDLARLLGGQIQLRSRPGEGSNFVLILPLAMPPRPAVGGTETLSGTPDAATGQRTETVAEAETPVASPPLPVPAPPPPPREAGRHFADDRDALPPQGRTMLVIEDDTPFAQVLVDLAHSHDFHCLVALNAADGLLLARQYRPDAILLDMKLPDCSA
ncbi:ATP-binding protein [Chitinimonas koreensis]|uniref:ATP-binding protein n=1 Tax=Chitinimonas koreensis TaxID=356302 RepID=UPI0027E3D516|nr:ATP-binding protein [Chitinimonas koreensis]